MGIKLVSNVKHLCSVKRFDKRKFIGLMASREVGEKTARKVFDGGTNLNAAVIAKTAQTLGVEFGEIIRIAK